MAKPPGVIWKLWMEDRGGVSGGEQLSQIGRLGARLVLQRAIDEEVEGFLQSLAL